MLKWLAGAAMTIVIFGFLAAVAVASVQENSVEKVTSQSGFSAEYGGAGAAGWQKSGGEWYYYDSEGKRVTGWLEDKGRTFYLNDEGVMQKGRETIEGKEYYFDASGVLQKGWFRVSADTGKYPGALPVFYTKNQSGYCWAYADEDGVLTFGWLQQGGKWYYLTDYRYIDEVLFHDLPPVVENRTATIDGRKYYFAGKSGQMRNRLDPTSSRNVWSADASQH